MIERKGDLICKVIKNTSYSEITPQILKYVEQGSILYTDEWKDYDKINDLYNHLAVNQSKKGVTSKTLC